jgi:nicotinamide mononucleotide transporter
MVGSVIATFMTLGRVVENWWYWVIINLTAVLTYGLKELWVTVGLYGVYSILSVWGLMAWRRAQAR